MPSKFQKFLNWLSLPPACKKHGRKHLFKHGKGKWECKACFDEMLGKICKYCGSEYTDPTYCSAFGRTADKHEFQ